MYLASRKGRSEHLKLLGVQGKRANVQVQYKAQDQIPPRENINTPKIRTPTPLEIEGGNSSRKQQASGRNQAAAAAELEH